MMMKNLTTLFFGTLLILGSSNVVHAQDFVIDGKGILKCNAAAVSDTATVAGNLYTAVDRASLDTMIGMDTDPLYVCTSHVTEMDSLFLSKANFNQDIGNWDVSQVTNMKEMFSKASTFNQDISSWNVGSVTDMTDMFNGASLSAANYDSLLSGWSELTLNTGVTFSGGNSNYCSSEAARQHIIDQGWTITDGGRNCPDEHFITTWKTDNPTSGVSNATSIAIPTFSGETYNYDVSWKNDGVWETGFTGDATHDYGTVGTYTVAIRGTFPRIYFEDLYAETDRRRILSIEQWGTQAWSSMSYAFGATINLVINATDTPDLSNVTDMSGMFFGASALNQGSH